MLRAVRGIQRVLQHLRRPEGQHAPRADLDLLPRLRVAADARLLLADDEVPEARELDLLALLQRVLEGVENHLDDLRGLFLGETDLVAHAFDDVSLGHVGNDTRGRPTRSNTKGKNSNRTLRRSPTCRMTR